MEAICAFAPAPEAIKGKQSNMCYTCRESKEALQFVPAPERIQGMHSNICFTYRDSSHVSLGINQRKDLIMHGSHLIYNRMQSRLS